MTYDYNKKLYEDYKKIKDKVERGMLPLVARIPAIDRATTEYAIALAEHYHANQAAGKNPPVPLKNAALLDRFANLIMWEELKWSHPDKMSIVEYPVMSGTQADKRYEREKSTADMWLGNEYSKIGYYKDEIGAKRNLYNFVTKPSKSISDVERNIDLYDALENAGLTDRQRQAIDLVFFENMTQETAARHMEISRRTFREHLDEALRKLREYLTKN